jgi:hypothetical protein
VRYLSWGRATAKRPNLLGQGGERVVHATLREAAPYGYRLVKPEGGEVDSLFGKPLKRGPFDNAAHLQLLDHGVPSDVITLPVEVKNRRIWIYPWVPELFELLDKAAVLQMDFPDRQIVPILVCRRAHDTTFKMAEDLGFFIAQARAQFLLPLAEVEPTHLEEVRRGLMFDDLRLQGDAYPHLVRLLVRTVPTYVRKAAPRWAAAAPKLAAYFQFLRTDRLAQGERHLPTMNELRREARTLPFAKGGW